MTYGHGDDRDDRRPPARPLRPPQQRPSQHAPGERAAWVEPDEATGEAWQPPARRRQAPAGYPPDGYPPDGYPPDGYPPPSHASAPPQYPSAQYSPDQYPPAQYPPAQYPPAQHPSAAYPPDPGYEPDPGYPDPGDPGYPDAGYPDPRYPDPRYPDPRHPDPRYPDPRNPDPRNPDPRYPDPRFPDSRYPDPRYPDPHHPDLRNAAPGRPAETYYDDGGYPQTADGYRPTAHPTAAQQGYEPPTPYASPAPYAPPEPYEQSYGYETAPAYDPQNFAPGYDPFEASGHAYRTGGYPPSQMPQSAPPSGRPDESGVYGRSPGGYGRGPEVGGYGRQPGPAPYSGPPDQDVYGRRSGTYIPGTRDPSITAPVPPVRTPSLVDTDATDASGRMRRRTWADERPEHRDERPGGGSPGPGPRQVKRSRGRALIAVTTTLVVVAAAAIVAYELTRPSPASTTSIPTIQRSPDDQAITSQKVDPAPLTVAEVFKGASITSSASGGGKYKVLGSQEANGCGVAVTDQLIALLDSAGCTQVVRATLTSPDGAYVITAGIFNLRDSAAATQAFTDIKADVDGHKGRFTGFATGGPGDIITQAQANLAWDTRGHYLTYAVIALTNGHPIQSGDTRTRLIVADVVEKYLGDKVLGARASRTATPSASRS